MSDASSNNKRIAKNTLILYLRLLFTMAISLYVSRIVLDVLGVVDFGIYNVVGGFVSMFTIISGAMTAATQRFLSFEIGKGKDGDVRSFFSSAVIIHVLLAAVILILAETVGLWFVNSQMNFPQERYVAVNWVFQLSVFTFIINVVSVPYNAAIIAYERMKAFAYISILEVATKLIVVLFLAVATYDKLISYAFLLTLIAALIRIIYGFYCKKNFKECRFTFVWNKEHGKQMLSFVGWNMIGSIAGVGKEQGINVLLNIFFGAAINAARGIAQQVLAAVQGFVSNFQLAMSPQIIKMYASNERDEMLKLVFRGSKFSFLLMLVLSLPLVFEAPFVLDVWLKVAPDYSVVFLRLILMTALVDSLSGTLITLMHASGKVRDYQIVVGGLSLMTLPLAYVLFKIGCEPYIAMVAGLATSVICHFARLLLLKYSVGFPVASFMLKVTFRCFYISLLSMIVPFWAYTSFDNSTWSAFFIVIVLTVLSSITVAYIFGLSTNERKFVKNKVNSILERIFCK